MIKLLDILKEIIDIYSPEELNSKNIEYKIEILQLIESKYNIEIKDEDVENVITIEDLIKIIISKQND